MPKSIENKKENKKKEVVKLKVVNESIVKKLNAENDNDSSFFDDMKREITLRAETENKEIDFKDDQKIFEKFDDNNIPSCPVILEDNNNLWNIYNNDIINEKSSDIDMDMLNDNINVINMNDKRINQEKENIERTNKPHNNIVAGIEDIEKYFDTEDSQGKFFADIKKEENFKKENEKKLGKKYNNSYNASEPKYTNNERYVCHVDQIYLGNMIDDFVENNFEMRKRIEKTYNSNICISIAAWNMQSLNKIYAKRQNKLEFVRNCINENKFDMIYLIDVNDNRDILLINNYKKYNDGRNILFVKNNIFNEFIVSKNCILDKQSKLAFTYVTPNSNDKILIDNVIFLIEKNFEVIGDINFRSNVKLHRYINSFIGEDSLQTGFIGKRAVRKFNSIAGPSDHFLIMGNVKCNITLDYPMRIKEISDDITYEYIESICSGKIPNVQPKVKPLQTYLNLNDRERIINNMMNDYLDNNVKRIYSRYKQVYYVGSREPFLGTKVNSNIVKTFAEHLDADENKKYVIVQQVRKSDAFNKYISISRTKSKAVTFDFMALDSISRGVRMYLKGNNCRESKEGDEFFEIHEVINNVIKVAHKMRADSIANTFFLVKNKRLADFNDVRMIVIMPGFIKVFESLTYNMVSAYFYKYFNEKGKIKYQYGGLKKSSTYLAMLDLRLKFEEKNAAGVFLLDLTKGFDSIDIELLVGCIGRYINRGPTQDVLYSWSEMVFNIDYIMNTSRVKRKKGVPMGLSFSPLIFEFYLDCALIEFDKSRMTGYVDDLAVVLNAGRDEEEINKDREYIFKLVDVLSAWGLEINNKSVLVTQNKMVKERFKEDFKIVDQDKYLGRSIFINGDGKILPDDRFYSRKAFRSFTSPYWANFFVKRIIFNNGVISKFAYGMFMFATKDRSIRNNTFRNAWFFFRASMTKFNYLQVVFAIRNVFRFFIDTYDIKRWIERKKKGESAVIIDDEVIESIKVDIPQIKDAISVIKPRWDMSDEKSIFEKTKKFNNYLFKKFKKNMLANYVKYKREKSEKYYYNLVDFLNSKLSIHFGYLHNIVFLHADFNKRTKQIGLFLFFKSFGLKVRQKIEEFASGETLNPTFDINSIFNNIDCNVDEIYKVIPDSNWNDIMCAKLQNLWPVIDDLIWAAKNSKHKMPKSKSCKYKIEENFANVYVDGSYNIKNNKVGYAWIFIKNGKIIESGSNWEYDGVDTYELKNIYGELRSSIIAVEKSIEKGYKGINLFFDYNGIQKYADFEWSSSDEFIVTYTNTMRNLRNKIKVNFIKVYSHTGDTFNDEVDKIAKNACGICPRRYDRNNSKYDEEERVFLHNLYKEIFKVMVVIDMVYMNNVLNDLDLFELLFNIRVKMANLDELAYKMYKIAEMEEQDEIFEGNNDIYGLVDEEE